MIDILNFKQWIKNNILIESISSDSVKSICRDIINFVKETKKLHIIGEKSAYNSILKKYNNKYDINCTIIREENDSLKISALYDDTELAIKILIQIDPTYEPNVYNILYIKLLEDIRHELEHIDQYENRPSILSSPEVRKKIHSDKKNLYKYFLLPEEVEAMVTGLYYRAKKEKKSIKLLFEDYLNYYLNNNLITNEQYNIIFDSWVQYSIKRFPNTHHIFYI